MRGRIAAMVVVFFPMMALAAPDATRPAFAPGTPTEAPSIVERITKLREEREKLVDQCQQAIAQHDGAIAALQQLLPADTPTPK